MSENISMKKFKLSCCFCCYFSVFIDEKSGSWFCTALCTDDADDATEITFSVQRCARIKLNGKVNHTSTRAEQKLSPEYAESNLF